MTDTDRLILIHRRQEAMISTLNDVLAAMEKQNAILVEVADWLQKPPSSDLGDTLKQLATAVTAMQATLVGLPEAVAQRIEHEIVA